MTSEDSGVIDLFAMHQRATASAKEVPRDLFSAPPPAFTTDLYSDPGLGGHSSESDDETGSNPFAKKSRKKLGFIAGGVGAFLVLVVVIVTASGGSEAPKATAAAAQPPPAAVALPAAAAVAPVVPPSAVAHMPAPPTTGAPVVAAAAPRARAAAPAAKARPAAGGGPKLTKIQSAGVAGR